MITMTHNDIDRTYTLKLNAYVTVVHYYMVEDENEVSRLWLKLVRGMSFTDDMTTREIEATRRNTIRFFNLQLAVERAMVRQPKTRQLMEGSVFV